MNKKEAIAYAQITLDYMQSPRYKGDLNLESFGLEMKQAINMYPRNIVLQIAEGKIYARNKFLSMKNGSDINE